jgi:fumarate hydratase class II
MMPVAAYNLLQAIDLLTGAITVLRDKCIEGLEATENGPRMVEEGLSIATPLATVVGYDRTAELANEAFRTRKTIREVAHEAKLLPDAELDQLLDARRMTGR